MGFRFRRTVRLLPGVRVNLSKSGASLSVGQRGATVNLGQKGVHTNVGIPGTGISYRSGNLAHDRERPLSDPPPSQPKTKISIIRVILIAFLGFTVLMGVISALQNGAH